MSIVLYSRSRCKKCIDTANKFKDLNIQHTVITDEYDVDIVMQNHGIHWAPVIMVDEVAHTPSTFWEKYNLELANTNK